MLVIRPSAPARNNVHERVESSRHHSWLGARAQASPIRHHAASVTYILLQIDTVASDRKRDNLIAKRSVLDRVDSWL